MLDYAIVVATRNRLDMLQACLPIFISQTRPPERLIVVDRSDDHDSVRALCESLNQTAPMPVEVIYGHQPNLPAQRNQGLDLVTEAVVIFPDDDVLWHLDTAARFLEVYEADSNCRYGAVSGVDIYSPPDTTEQVAIPERQLRLTDRPRVMAVRNAIEAALVPQPFEVYGAEQTARLAPAAERDGLGYPLVSTIGGYRMSFRTEVAKAVRFDELLGTRIGYAVHEDKDMALRVLKAGHLIAVAPQARVFHNVHPGKRANGFSYGFFHVLNYLYVCRKIFPDGSRALRLTHRYLSYKVALYGVRLFTDAYNRDVFHGAKAALSEYSALADARPEELADRYAEACDRHR